MNRRRIVKRVRPGTPGVLDADLARIHDRAQRTYRELARLYRQLDELGRAIERHQANGVVASRLRHRPNEITARITERHEGQPVGRQQRSASGTGRAGR